MPRTTTTVEILIIGGGVIGSSIAYHVARQGRKVLVVEGKEIAVEPVASWASAGGIRPQGLHPAFLLRMIQRSIYLRTATKLTFWNRSCLSIARRAA